MQVWRITKSGVLDECMTEFPPLTDENVRWLCPMRERLRILLTVRGDQIHKFQEVRSWVRSSSNAAGYGRWWDGGISSAYSLTQRVVSLYC